MEINTGKTKTMRVNTNQDAAALLEGQAIEEVNKSTYLGSVVSKTGGTDKDVKARITEAHHTFTILKRFKPAWKVGKSKSKQNS